jgi:uncharacterized protein YbjQ (UPF0145 family)
VPEQLDWIGMAAVVALEAVAAAAAASALDGLAEAAHAPGAPRIAGVDIAVTGLGSEREPILAPGGNS